MPKRESVFFEEGTVKFDSFLTQNKLDVFFKSFVNRLRNANTNPLPGSFSKRKSNLIVWKLPFKAADSSTIFNYKPVGDEARGAGACAGARPEQGRARRVVARRPRVQVGAAGTKANGKRPLPRAAGPAAPGSH